jgi:hypothetical protein
VNPIRQIDTKHPQDTPRPVAGKSDRWEFYQDTAKRWHWKKYLSDAIVASSPDCFTSFQECIGHAQQSGYVAPMHGRARQVSAR